jgi:hypothetical protein
MLTTMDKNITSGICCETSWIFFGEIPSTSDFFLSEISFSDWLVIDGN